MAKGNPYVAQSAVICETDLLSMAEILLRGASGHARQRQ
jgi:hypothetical protein